MEKFLQFLVLNKYSAQVKGKSWWITITNYDEGEDSRLYKLGFEIIFTPEMVQSVEVRPEKEAIITLIH